MISALVANPWLWLVVWLLFLLGYVFGATMRGNANYGRGWEEGYAKGAHDAADAREVMPAEGSPFVRDLTAELPPFIRHPSAAEVREAVEAYAEELTAYH